MSARVIVDNFHIEPPLQCPVCGQEVLLRLCMEADVPELPAATMQGQLNVTVPMRCVGASISHNCIPGQ